MKNNISIRVAILMPFVLVIILIILIFSVIFANGSDQLAQEQGTQLLNSLSDTANEKITFMLKEPLVISSLYADLIRNGEYYLKPDLTELQVIALGLTKKIHDTIPQIDTIGYGDDLQRFLAVRSNPDDTYTLMVQDALTNDKLNIYSGETRQSEIVSAIENYNPKTRPWYAPVIENPISQWSDIYINQDEVNDATISSLVPVLDAQNNLASVVCIDVSLKEMNTYLNNLTNDTQSLIYIVDEEENIISHSTDDPIYNLTGAETDATFYKSSNHSNPLIQESSKYFDLEKTESVVNTFTYNNENYFIKTIHLDPELAINWKLVVIIPEKSLVGNIQVMFHSMNIVIITLSITGMILGTVLINFFITPMIKMSRKIEKINLENLNTTDVSVPSLFNFKELNVFSSAVNSMIHQLDSSLIQLQDSQKQYKILIDNSDALIYSMDAHGNLRSANTQFLNATSTDESELLNLNIYDIFGVSEEQTNLVILLHNVLKSKKIETSTYTVLSNEGSKIIYDCRIVPVLNENGDITQVIGSFTNITDLILAHEKIAEMAQTENTKLEELVKERTAELEFVMSELIQKEKLASLGSLVSGISHEINTPLGVAVSATSYLISLNQQSIQALEEGTMTKERLIKYIESFEESSTIIYHNINRAKELVNSFKQISVNSSHDEMSQFNLKEYLEATLMSLKHELRTHTVNVTLDCQPEITLFGNPSDIHQIFSNLIMNSIIHGFEQHSQGNIIIACSIEKNTILIRFEDDGKGIDPVIINRIFDPFFTTNRNNGGSGLGLNIVYNIIIGKYKGTIHVNNQSKGVQFIISIPTENR